MQWTARFPTIPTIHKPVILIGATGVGKSTQAYLVAKALGVPQVSVDGIAAELYCHDDIFREAFEATRDSTTAEGAVEIAFQKLASQLKASFYDFEEHLHKEAVTLALRQYGCTPCIMDFGSGHTSYTSKVRRRQVYETLIQQRPVILLQPHESLTDSANYLYEHQTQVRRLTQSQIEHELRLAGNREFATHTILTAMKSRETVTEEIIDVIKSCK